MLKLNNKSQIIVQGMTGSYGQKFTSVMKNYGTQIVAGINPNKKDDKCIIDNISYPIYASIKECKSKHKVDASIIFVPAPFVLNAVIDAINNNIKYIVIITEHIPVKDNCIIKQLAIKNKVTIVGPNTAGLLIPEVINLGIIPTNYIKKGNCVIISRSGTLSYLLAYELIKQKKGIHSIYVIGGDRSPCSSYINIINKIKNDKSINEYIIVGEPGNNLEIECAKYCKTNNIKNIKFFLVGKTLPANKQFGHAGAITNDSNNTVINKINIIKKLGFKII